MKKTLQVILICILLGCTLVRGQNYNMSNTTISTCSGNLYDSGGPAGNYGNNENNVMTICAPVAGQCVQLSFNNFLLQNGNDFLTVYDGPTTGALALGTFTGTGAAMPAMFTASTGCLTLEFTSNAATTNTGFAATISCGACTGAGCTACSGGPPPSNDNCTTPLNLGLIPTPAACPNGTGAWANFNTTNVCATPGNPYTSLIGCQPSGNMSSPSSDVWYRFTLTGPVLNVQINGLQTPTVGLYSGNNCNNLIPRGCALGSGGSLTTMFDGLAAGTYFLQVSGGTVADQCDFTLSLQNNYDCQGCVINSNLTVSPPPVNGTYLAGQAVTFCYTITNYNQTSINWLHGVVPTFASGWDMSTLTTVNPANCSGAGAWNWYNTNVTSTATGSTTGPGFYYESGLGSPSGFMDGNPGNNYGDNNPNNLCDWTFCWTISTPPVGACVQGASLNLSINTLGDGESGSWTSFACSGDPQTDFFATLSCCEAPTLVITNPLCFGQNTGSVTASMPNNNNPPFNYTWMNGVGTTIQTTNGVVGPNTINNLAPGNYSLSVRDFAGCIASVNFVIVAPTQLQANVTPTPSACNGASTGTATANPSGGTGAYSYNWAPSGGSGQVASGLAAGTYTVTVTDANGCTVNASGVVIQPAALVVNTVPVNATCGQSNGSMTINVLGGTGAIQYSITGGAPYQPGNNFTGLAAGNYNVQVIDASGCTGTVVGVVGNAAAPTITSTPSTLITCNGGNNGSITVNANGGTGAISYSLNGGAPQPGNIFNGLTAGNYTITITDANGCTATSNQIVSEPTLVQANANSTVSTCSASNGSVTINSNGGTGAYTYSLNGGASQPGNTFSNLAAANYSVTVTDANGCTAVVNIAVIDEPAPTITATPATLVTCNGGNDGSISVTANGGTGAISYSLNGGAPQAGNTFNGLTAGNYSVTITDANGCTATANQTVSEPTAVTGVPATTTASCGNSDGTLTVVGSGGTGAFQYSINNGTSYQPAGAFVNLLAGNYAVIVMDANGCTGTVNASVSNSAAPVISSVNSTHLTCFGSNNGTITINANNGTGALQYSINNGTTFQAGNNYTNLSPGNYNIVVEDALGCQATSNIIITQPAQLVLATVPVNTTCGQANGTLTINAVGGTGAYTYSSNGGAPQAGNVFSNISAGAYSIVVTDANGCTATVNANINDAPGPNISNVAVTNVNCNGAGNGQINITTNGGTGAIQYSIDNGTTFQATAGFNNLTPGNYNIVVTDANGCTAVSIANITQPTAIAFSTSSTPASCGNNDGTLTINANGGTGAFQYSIDNGVTFQPLNNFTNILAGNYTVIVQDANGCTASNVATVNNAAAPAITTTAFTDVICFGANDGTITVTANGGTGVLQYSIDNGVTFQAGNAFNNLAPGNYNIVVQDINGCDATAVVVITQPAQLVLVPAQVNTTCGQSNGSISIAAAGGTGVYSYASNGGAPQAGNTFSNIAAGNYNVVVTDANGCTASSNIVVTDAPGPNIASVVITNVDCNGADNGELNITSNGGTGIIEYSIDNGATFQPTASFNNLAPGIYNIVITDANGCTNTTIANITEPPAIAFVSSSTPASCGNSDGTLTINANGGTGAYTYSIDNGLTFQAGNNFAGILSGNYNVIVQDANGCTFSAQATVNNAAAPTISATAFTDITCFGANNGTITITAAGGTGFLQYSIDNGITLQPGNVFNNLTPGNYDIVVVDINGCDATSNITITEPLQVTANIVTVNTTCSSANGSFTINASGGTGTYTYSSNNGSTFQASSSFNNISSGNYNIVIEDGNGCTATYAVNLTNAPAPVIPNINAVNITCNGAANGSLNINTVGGTLPLQFSIDNGLTNQSANLFSNLSPGSYSILVTDANGCTVASAANITQPAAISASFSSTNSSCGNADGTLTMNASGGSGVLQFSIDNGVSFQTATTFNFLPSGNYTVIVMDANGCTTSLPTTVNNAAAPSIQNVPFTNVVCNGNGDGTITINASGGTGALTYSIDNGITTQTGNSYTGLIPGIYNIVVTDINGCTATSQVVISQPALLTATAVSVTATCGNSNGTITINGLGGTAPLQYSSNNGTTFQPGAIFNNLAQGTYNLVVTDANGCSFSLNKNVANAAGPNVSLVIGDNLTCFASDDGEITIIANGGTAPLQYSIDNGVTFSSNIVFGSLTFGNYNIVVMDANGCTSTSSALLTQPTEIIYSTVVVDASCGSSNGSITINASGGSGTYTYSIDNGATFQPSNVFNSLIAGSYDVVVRDAVDCMKGAPENVSNVAAPVILNTPVNNIICNGQNNGSITVNVNGGTGALSYSINGGFTWQPSSVFNNLIAGSYNISVTDMNGCVATAIANITEPAAINLSSSSITATCGNNDGSLSVNASGGNGALSYSLNGGPAQPGGSFSNLAAGNYNIIVTDASGCSASTITSVSNTNAPVITAVNNTDVTCFGLNDGSINITANGGTGVLNYSIDNGVTFQATGIFNNLPGGSYSIVIEDANGCEATSSIIIVEPALLNLNTLAVNSTCGNSNGEIQTLLSGGTGIVQYSINNGVTFQASGIFQNLATGNYSILVTDANGCTSSSAAVVSNIPGPIVASIPLVNVTCFGLNNGNATINLSGGTGPFNYSINGGTTSQMNNYFGSLAPGNYNVSVTDANGCTVIDNLSITQPPAVTVSFVSNNTTCSDSNGEINISGNGGTGTYTYSINGGLSYQTSNLFPNIAAGNYTVTVQDANGCTVSTAAIISDAASPVVQSIVPVDALCNNSNDGQISLTTSGGTLPLQYSIDNGVTYQLSNQFNNLNPGVYTVIVSDANGCTVSASETIHEPDAILTSVSSIASTCNGGSNGSATVSAMGGIAPYSYNWSTGTSSTVTATNLIAGSYSVTITDANGCTVITQANVSNIGSPVISALSTVNSTCNNSDNGSATVSHTGGVGPFTYSINAGTTTQTTSTFNNLSPNNYTVIVTDANGCSTNSLFTITEPDVVSAALVIANTTCSDANGEINITAIGGTGTYQYSNDGGFTYQTSNIFSNLLAGNYTIMVQDINGCTSSDPASIIDAPGPDVQSVIPVNVSCFGLGNGTITLSATGGTLPLQYSIDNGVTNQPSNNFTGLAPGAYTILVTDANGCTIDAASAITEPAELITTSSSTAALCFGSSDGSAIVNTQGGTSPYSYSWSNGNLSSGIVNVVAGSYSVTVTDANGCTNMVSATVAEPLPLAVQNTVTNITCNGLTNGGVGITVSGGTAPFSYFWSNLSVTPNINGLGAGNYSVTITDDNGCTNTQSYVVTEPTALSLSTSAIATSCFGTSNGSATVNANGGTAPYSYLWSNNAVGLTANGLTAGTYTVTVTDNNGCSTTVSETIISPDLLVASSTSTAVTCNGDGDGTATVSVIGGTTPYTYYWNNGTTSAIASNLNGGNATVTVTDNNGCISSSMVMVQEPAALIVTVSGATTICIGQTALVSASAQGGNGGYQFTWSNGVSGSNQTVGPNNTSSYSVNVVDSLGCPASSSALVITVNPALALTITPADTICEGEQVQISAIASGGDGGPYIYHWAGLSSTLGTISTSPSTTTTYTVTVTDGCTTPSALATVEILVNLLPVVNFVPVPAEGCAPLEVYFNNLTVSTTPGAFYTWYFGDNTTGNDFEPVHWYYEPGAYTVTLKAISAEGCANQLVMPNAVNVFPVPIAGIHASPPVASILYPVIDFTDTGNGATGWIWDFGDHSSYGMEQNPQHTYAAVGVYPITLYVVNDFGCRDTANYEIVIEGASTVFIPNAFSPNGDGVNDIFNVSGIGLTDIQMSIYNRWGHIVFNSEGSVKGWDGIDMYSGTACQIGVYVYVVTAKTFNGESHDYTGRVTLLE